MPELPYQTYERLTGKKWTSGKSADVKALLSQFGIKAAAGSEQANNELQRALKAASVLESAGVSMPTLPTPPMPTPGRISTDDLPMDRLAAGYRSMRGSNTLDQFTPEDETRITNALTRAAALYGSGAAIGTVGGVLSSVAPAGLLADAAAEEAMGLGQAPAEIRAYVSAMRQAIAEGNRMAARQAVTALERELPQLEKAATQLGRGRYQTAARRPARITFPD
jgi:hypothetical protein